MGSERRLVEHSIINGILVLWYVVISIGTQSCHLYENLAVPCYLSQLIAVSIFAILMQKPVFVHSHNVISISNEFRVHITQSKSKTIITRRMCVISLIVFTNTVHGHVTIFIPNGFSLHSNFTHHEHKSLEQEITISFSSKSYYTKTQRLNQINTCFAFCLSLLIWNT